MIPFGRRCLESCLRTFEQCVESLNEAEREQLQVKSSLIRRERSFAQFSSFLREFYLKKVNFAWNCAIKIDFYIQE
jgi:hypothetical protein